MLLKDLEFIIDCSEYVKIFDLHNKELFFGKWYQCKFQEYPVLDLYPDNSINTGLNFLNIRIAYESQSE